MGEALNLFLRHSEGLGSASFFAFLLTVLIALGLWSGLGQLPLADILKGPSARHLFLTVPMQVATGQGAGAKGAAGKGAKAGRATRHAPDLAKAPDASLTAHLTAMNAQRATFISPISLAKGAKIRLDLKSLPDFPEAPGLFEVEVRRSSRMKGKADSFWVEASFGRLDTTMKTPLLSYLQRLAGAARLSAG